MGYVYWLLSNKNAIYDLPSIHWYICILLRTIILIVILGPFYRLLEKRRKDTEIVMIEEENGHKPKQSEDETELALPSTFRGRNESE